LNHRPLFHFAPFVALSGRVAELRGLAGAGNPLTAPGGPPPWWGRATSHGGIGGGRCVVAPPSGHAIRWYITWAIAAQVGKEVERGTCHGPSFLLSLSLSLCLSVSPFMPLSIYLAAHTRNQRRRIRSGCCAINDQPPKTVLTLLSLV